jgi:hypothetical protein
VDDDPPGERRAQAEQRGQVESVFPTFGRFLLLSPLTGMIPRP